MTPRARRVLLTGATGFVGSYAFATLRSAGFELRCASRNPKSARQRHPERDWVRLDVERPETLGQALRDIDVVIYLVHAMGKHGADYAEVEGQAARALARAAEDAGVGHIVYLGGVEPAGPASKHLRSRLETGRILREGEVPTLELRAGMIVGEGSESWQICCDLARLPAMILPQWLRTRSQPVAIEDVVHALSFAAGLQPEASAVYDIPGPETVTAREILERIAELRGAHPWMLEVPFLSPRISGYWLRLVTRADYGVARELIEGLTSDLLAANPELWAQMPEHCRVPLPEAMRRALERAAQSSSSLSSASSS